MVRQPSRQELCRRIARHCCSREPRPAESPAARHACRCRRRRSIPARSSRPNDSPSGRSRRRKVGSGYLDVGTPAGRQGRRSARCCRASRSPSNAVGEATLVTRGTAVQVVFEQGGLTITDLRSAARGWQRRATSSACGTLDSGVVIMGVVQPDGTVRVVGTHDALPSRLLAFRASRFAARVRPTASRSASRTSPRCRACATTRSSATAW